MAPKRDIILTALAGKVPRLVRHQGISSKAQLEISVHDEA